MGALKEKQSTSPRFLPHLLKKGPILSYLYLPKVTTWDQEPVCEDNILPCSSFPLSSIEVHFTESVSSITGPTSLMRIFMFVTPVPSLRCQPLRCQNGPGSNGEIDFYPLMSHTLCVTCLTEPSWKQILQFMSPLSL